MTCTPARFGSRISAFATQSTTRYLPRVRHASLGSAKGHRIHGFFMRPTARHSRLLSMSTWLDPLSAVFESLWRAGLGMLVSSNWKWCARSLTRHSIAYYSFPLDIPRGAAVPVWAYQDVRVNERTLGCAGSGGAGC
ncbi:hypothetical protein C8Q76DRAFT_15018 [Earliella scabrosa]|nr:hypothetical protein C8Q76DRAFT_15018 [Earliella scabrosa]